MEQTETSRSPEHARTVTESSAPAPARDEEQAAGGDRAPAGDSIVAGTRIKHYEVLRELGSGGSAGVLLARDTRLGRLVALKVPRRRKHATDWLLAEARTLARLAHENIVMVYDVDDSSEHPYMTLEYIRGHTLHELIRPAGLRAPVALEVMIPVARALAHAHDLGIVHRDLKPRNIMVADAGSIKLVDFGLARPIRSREWPAAGPARRAWGEGGAGGTLLYMAPEQIGSDLPDHRCDLWAVGIILHELCTGAHPFVPFPPGWIRRVLDLDEEVPLAVPPGALPDGLVEVLQRCLKKRRGDRFRTAGELATALEDVVGRGGARRGTWAEHVRRFKRSLARRAFEEHGSYATAAARLRVGRRTLRKHADGD